MEQRGPWRTLSRNQVYASPWIEVEHHEVIAPGGNAGTYGTVHFRNLAIGIVPLDEQLNTWIVGQYRYPIQAYSWEIPEGGGDRSVPPLESAKRELREETGIIASSWTEIQRMDLSNSASDEHAILYVAQGLTFFDPEPDANEELQVEKLPFKELFLRVMNGEIKDSLTVAAVLKTELLLRAGALDPAQK
ncbi:MAG: NUDIX hydrolase [Flavobacteriales bacterium]|nr:NUDIX hydrolase [Flavobacteriales bacterium]MCB1128606.1 NUDIX hydrolase [Verrucomicrobiae bacterium]